MMTLLAESNFVANEKSSEQNEVDAVTANQMRMNSNNAQNILSCFTRVKKKFGR
jgi:hypothetical protein